MFLFWILTHTRMEHGSIIAAQKHEQSAETCLMHIYNRGKQAVFCSTLPSVCTKFILVRDYFAMIQYT